MTRQRIIFIISTLLVLIVAGVAITSYYTSTTAYTISYSHASNLLIIRTTDGDSSTVSKITKSGEMIRLSNNDTYQVTYSGESGYADGSYTIKQGVEQVTINPDFSADHYQTLITQALPKVRTIISKWYPSAEKFFNIDTGMMTEKGVWFVALLEYKGEYNSNADNLRVLLKYENNTWKLVTEPNILLTTTNYPRLPEDILSWANSVF